MITQQPAGLGRQIVGARPADIAAAMALAGVAVARSDDDDPPGTAGKAFDPKLLHAGAIRHKADTEGSLGRGTTNRSNTWAGPSRRGSPRSRCWRRSRPRPSRR